MIAEKRAHGHKINIALVLVKIRIQIIVVVGNCTYDLNIDAPISCLSFHDTRASEFNLKQAKRMIRCTNTSEQNQQIASLRTK